MTKEYLLEDLQRLFEKTRTQALRFAQLQGWTVEKKKLGKFIRMFIRLLKLMLIYHH